MKLKLTEQSRNEATIWAVLERHRVSFFPIENNYFPFPGDERKVALQVWVWERTIVKVKIAGD